MTVFLTPFKVKRIKTTLDDYMFTSDDQIIEGEIEEGKLYTEADFNKIIEIKEREVARVKIYMDEANQSEKAIIFCATQEHAAAVRDLVNQYKKVKNQTIVSVSLQMMARWENSFCVSFKIMKSSFPQYSPLHKNSPQELMLEISVTLF